MPYREIVERTRNEILEDGAILCIRMGADDPVVEACRAAVQPDDMATIIYTSGTTGKPKGVMLSHDNIVSNVLSVQTIFPIKAGERALSFLPICHSFERAAS